MPYPVKGFTEMYEDMVQILLLTEVFTHRILRLKICSAVFLPALKPKCSSAIIGFKPIKDGPQYALARMTDKANGSVVLAVLECDNERLSPSGRPFPSPPDHVSILC